MIVRFALISVLNVVVLSQVTNLAKKNPLLSRRKRYLAFPMNSNFVVSMAYAKAFLRAQPRGWNAVGELDVPFPLPSDTRLFKKYRSHYVQRREILDTMETEFTRNGFNGNACVKRMICEARQYIDMEGKSLVKDILSAIFKFSEDDLGEKYGPLCHDATFSGCEISFLGYILSSALVR